MLLVLIMDLLMRNLEVHRSIVEFFIFLFLWEEYFKLCIYVKRESSSKPICNSGGTSIVYISQTGRT